MFIVQPKDVEIIDFILAKHFDAYSYSKWNVNDKESKSENITRSLNCMPESLMKFLLFWTQVFFLNLTS